MICTRKLKTAVIVLIILSISVLPMAFCVSYAKWTGGSNSIYATVNVVIGGGTISDKPFSPSDLTQIIPNGGVVMADSNGNPILPEGYFGETGGLGSFETYGEGDLYPPQGEQKIRIQLFRTITVDGKKVLDTTPVDLPLGSDSGRYFYNGTTGNIDFEGNDGYIVKDGNWYELYRGSFYSFEIHTENGREVLTIKEITS